MKTFKSFRKLSEAHNTQIRDLTPEEVLSKYGENRARDLPHFRQIINTAKKMGKKLNLNVYTDDNGVKVIVDIEIAGM